MIRAAVLFLVLSLTQTATFGGEPHSFYYFKADYCGPCRKFKVASPRLVPALESMFVCVPAINLETPEGKRLGVTFEITRIPAFIVVDANGYEVGRFTGFTPGNEPEFLRRCRVLANSVAPRTAVRRTEPRGRPQSPPEQPQTTPKPSSPDSAIEDANRRLREELDEAETARRIANDEVEAARRREHAIRKAREVDRETIAELKRRLEQSLAPLWNGDDNLIDSVFGPADDPKPTEKPPAKTEQPAKPKQETKPPEDKKPETQTPPTPAKQPASESAKTDLSSKWAGVVTLQPTKKTSPRANAEVAARYRIAVAASDGAGNASRPAARCSAANTAGTGRRGYALSKRSRRPRGAPTPRGDAPRC